MIVEPAPTSPRTPARRGLRVLGMLLPVVLLVGVVAARTLGPKGGVDATPGPSSSGGTEQAVAIADRGPFPETWIGFRVWSVADAQRRWADGIGGGLVAVAGYLSYGSLSWTCVDAYLDVDRAACDGRATIADAPGTPGISGGTGTGAGGIGAHVHPTFPPGVRGPTPDGGPSQPRSEPIPVVVLGSFDDPRAGACVDGERCDESFVVERVVWVAGAPWGPTLTIDPAMGVEPNIPEIQASVRQAVQALPPGSLPLETAIVRPGALATVDPDAAAALPPLPPGDLYRPLTYIRALVFQFDASQPLYGRDPRVDWVVLASIPGTVLARGTARDASPGTSMRAP